jgi:hypothetical protein
VSGRAENVSGESVGDGKVGGGGGGDVEVEGVIVMAEQAGKVKQSVSFNSGTARGSASRKGAGTRSGHRLE